MPPTRCRTRRPSSTIKSNSSARAAAASTRSASRTRKGDEQIFVHGEKDEDVRIKNDAREWIGNERHLIVKKDQLELVKEGDKHGTVKGDHLTKVEGDRGATIVGDRLVKIQGADHLTITGNQLEKIGTGPPANKDSKVTGNWSADVGMKVSIKGGIAVVIEGGTQVSLKVGGNFIDINPAGVFIKGTLVMINSGGAAGSVTAPAAPEAPDAPKAPKEATDADPGEKAEPPPVPTPPKPGSYSPAAIVMKQAAEDGTPFCEECERAREKEEDEWREAHLKGKVGITGADHAAANEQQTGERSA